MKKHHTPPARGPVHKTLEKQPATIDPKSESAKKVNRLFWLEAGINDFHIGNRSALAAHLQ